MNLAAGADNAIKSDETLSADGRSRNAGPSEIDIPSPQHRQNQAYTTSGELGWELLQPGGRH